MAKIFAIKGKRKMIDIMHNDKKLKKYSKNITNEVFRLRIDEKKTYVQIAKILHIGTATVKMILMSTEEGRAHIESIRLTIKPDNNLYRSSREREEFIAEKIKENENRVFNPIAVSTHRIDHAMSMAYKIAGLKSLTYQKQT